MTSKTIYLCEKPDQGRIVAQALGGGQKTQGGITGSEWAVTWGFGHLMTPYMPQDYDEDLKKWEWDPLPIVPEKFQFKPKDGSATKQLSAISKLFKGAGRVIISTDADREGEMIAYEIINKMGWKGDTGRLWLSDLTIPAVKAALAQIKDAAETKPLYWAAAARTYADWIVGMNLSRAATLKLAAPGAKPMSVGRVQTPVLAMIVDLERKITNFKPETYYEITANVASASGEVVLRHAPPAEKRITERKTIETMLASVQSASGPISARTEAKKQGPPSLLDLNALQQECNSQFGWSADKSLTTLQKLYETHNVLTYPRTDSRALPEDHRDNIDTITGHLVAHDALAHLTSAQSSPVVRSATYDDKKVTAHHAIVPTKKPADISALTDDEAALYIMVARFYLAAHLPDMEYNQTTLSMDANGVPLKASGRQVTKDGWKIAFRSPSGDAVAEDEDEENNDEATAKLPPIKDGETGNVKSAKVDEKQTKPPERFTEKSLLQAMKNVSSHVSDPEARKKLKETSGIGTPATRANVIETLKTRDYIKIRKRKIQPTETGDTLIDAMRATAPGYADPVMTAQWEDVLETIATGGQKQMMSGFVSEIANTVEKDVAKIKASDIKAQGGAGHGAGRSRKSGGSGAGRLDGDWKARIANGTPLKVTFDQKDKAKSIGARWDSERKSWVIPEGVDEAPFKKAGFL